MYTPPGYSANVVSFAETNAPDGAASWGTVSQPGWKSDEVKYFNVEGEVLALIPLPEKLVLCNQPWIGETLPLTGARVIMASTICFASESE